MWIIAESGTAYNVEILNKLEVAGAGTKFTVRATDYYEKVAVLYTLPTKQAALDKIKELVDSINSNQ